MNKVAINFALPFSILREGDSFVAYTPVLDLSTTGSTFKEAQKNFEEIVNIFFKELMEMGTLNEVLKDLGWERQNETFAPPVVVENSVQKFSIPAIN
jgi:predicted RNase H-like HicB family nuclease